MMRLVTAVAFLVSALPALAQSKPGDKATVSVESTIDVEITVRDGSGAGETARLLNLVRRETFEQEVLTAADGVATSINVTVLASTLQKSGTDTPLEEKATALANRTYTSTRGAIGWMARDADGNAAPAEGATLGAWNDAAWLLPKGGPKAGSQWEIDAPTVAAIMSPLGMTDPAGKLSCTCQAVDGGKASVVFSGKLTGKAKDDAVITLSIKAGRLEYDLSKGRLAMLSLSGSFESLLSVEDVFRRPNENLEERRKVGEISVKSRKLEVNFTVK